MRERRLLAILGSPRQNGVTAQMLQAVADGAARRGWHVDRVRLCEQDIAPCRGCRRCLETGTCVIGDDGARLAELLRRCDAVALAAPVYWANVPGPVKNLFDRLLGTAMEETAAFPRPRLSRRQAYLLLTACHTPFPFSWLWGQSRGALRAMEEFFKTAGMRRAGRFVVSNTGRRHTVPEALRKRLEEALG